MEFEKGDTVSVVSDTLELAHGCPVGTKGIVSHVEVKSMFPYQVCGFDGITYLGMFSENELAPA